MKLIINYLTGKIVANFPTEGNVVGCDFSGIIVKLGSDVSEDRFKLGDAVAGTVHGCMLAPSFSLHLCSTKAD